MQPIKTTNAMNPAPAKGIQSLPTPVIDDVIITEIVNAWKGDYQKLEYGTMWDSVQHGSQQGSFPEHKLVFQQVSSEDGQWVKRIWVNDRVNQDSYNYAIKYSAGSQEHPIYIRTYIVPRDGYAPLPDGTPDPLFPTALLVDEEANRTENELDSKYITVTRVYETIPGPAVPTRRYNQRGDLETVLVQTVPPNTQPTPDGLLVTGSQVEQVETGKGVKTTATVQDHALLQIKEKKDGLLGETITTDDIVDPSTNPDALSQTVIASTVEQYTATKARKRTTTATGPTTLSGKAMTTQFGGGVVSSVEEIVAPNSTVSPNFRTVSTNVIPIDSSKSKKETVELPDGEEWPTLTDYKDGPFNERIIITSKVVPINTPLPNNSGAIIWESESADKWRSIHTSRNCSALLNKEFIEYQTASFTFPALLKIRGRTLSSVSNIIFQRPSQSGIFITKTITEYTEDLPDFFEDPYTISTVSFSSDAGSFSGVLHNCFNYISDEQTIKTPQSFPSSMNYAIGDEVLIRQSTEKDQIGLYKTVKTYIELI